MAVKKKVLVKKGKTVSKAAVKKVVKPTPVTPKKVVKPVAVKKTATKKQVSKSVPKKAVKPALASVKKIVKKPVTKVIAKKVPLPVKSKAPLKKAILPVKKTIAPIKVIIKAAVKTPVKAVKPAPKPMAKKEDVKKVVAKPIVVKAAPTKPAVEVKAKDIKVPAPKPVVIPKISTKTVRKYEPEFTKSVLDKAQLDPGAPSLRYSDFELVEFRELIQRKMEAAKKELAYLHGLITRKDEMGGDEGDNRYMTMEDGSLSMEREQLSQMASRQITFIDHLEKAIMRIENKTYGICRVTGKLIDKARLRAVPHATLSIEAKMSSAK